MSGDFFQFGKSHGVEIPVKQAPAITIEKAVAPKIISRINAKTPQGVILGLNHKFIHEAKVRPERIYTVRELEIMFGEVVRVLNLMNKQVEKEFDEWDKKLPLLDKTLNEETKREILERMHKGLRCPACNQFVKRYKTKLNSGMAICLIHLFKMNAEERFEGGFVHINQILKERGINPTNLSIHKLRAWDLVQPKTLNKDEEKNQGFWKITEKGKLFVLGKAKVPRHFYSYNREILGYSDEETDIKTALGDKFDYEELMRS